jgi:hypothetical protein
MLAVLLVFVCFGTAFIAWCFVNDEIRRHTIKKNSASVRETYGKHACTCNAKKCRGAHWKHWACPSPDMTVGRWVYMKSHFVRPVSSVKTRRSVRVHSVVSLSVFSG